MPSLRIHLDHCPCGSGRVISDCCLRSCGNLTPSTTASSISNDRCYANSLDNCTREISGEHWISANLLRIINPTGNVTVGGAPWQKEGETKSISIRSLQSKVLCTQHNAALSPLDAIGGRFFGAFPSSKQSKPVSSVNLYCGIDFERWMLKVLCGGVFSGVLQPAGGPLKNWRPPRTWLEYVFGETPFSPPLGLYFCQKPGDRVAGANSVSIALMAADSEPYGLSLHVHGLLFVLTTIPLNLNSGKMLEWGAIYRPSTLSISGSDCSIVLIFDWGAEHQGGEVKVNWISGV